jgi:hypothetical protein
MKSEEFKDFHDYFHCSRNNLYKYTKDKFETTLEYYEHLYNIKEIDKNKCLEIFKANDIAIVPKERIRIFYSYAQESQDTYNALDTIEEPIIYNDYETLYNIEEEDFNIKKSLLIFKKSEGNIPMVFKKNIRYYNITDEVDNDSGISYDYFSGEENESESSGSEEIF